MSGRCYACADSFKKLFSGEKGCKNCGFEFCKKCITKKIAIPKLKNEVDYVCNKCYNLLSSGKKLPKQRPPSPPKAYLKRMEELEKREAKKGNDTSKQNSNNRQVSKPKADKYAGMESVDADLMRRFDKLKEDREKQTHRPDTREIESRLAGLKAGKPEPPTEQEMRSRLAELQGKQQKPEEKGKQYFAPERRSEAEQVVDLMDKFFDEHQIDGNHQHGNNEADDGRQTIQNNQGQTSLATTGEIDIKEINAMIEKSAKELQLDAENAILSLQQDKELMARLQELKNKKNSKENTTDMDMGRASVHTVDNGDDEENEDLIAEGLIKQYLAEAKLDAEAAATTQAHQENRASDDRPGGRIPEVYQPDNPEVDEFPWCCICNDDAKIRCFDCNGDLYCAQCFGEGHKDNYMKDHEFERYCKKKDC